MAQELFSGIVKGGTFKADDSVRFAGRMARLEGRRVRASFRRESTGRTMSQNAYYWAVVVRTIAEWSGYDPNSKEECDAVHDGLKRKHLGEEEINGLVVAKASRTLPVEEFASYVDRVLRWAAEQGCYIPEPHEVVDV